MPDLAMRHFNPFAVFGRAIERIEARPEPELEPEPRNDEVRREYLNDLLSADYHGCNNEYGAMALMALFPRDF